MKKKQPNLAAPAGPNLAQRVYKISRVWVILALALIFPFLGANNYLLHMANISMMFAILTISLNVLSGFTGLMSVGHIAFFGIGAYTAAILSTTYQMPLLVGFIAAGVVSALFSLLLGLPTMRLKGMYFSVATMAFGEVIYQIIKNWESMTKGTKGITKIPAIEIFGVSFKEYKSFYYLMLLGLIVVIVLTYNLKNSRSGRAMLAIRANDIAAEAMGVNVVTYKLVAFMERDMATREPFYGRATLVVECDGRSDDEIIEYILTHAGEGAC